MQQIGPPPEIRRLPLTSLKPAGYNPRTMSAEARRGLEASMARWGCVQPIVWNKRTGNVVSGHQRLTVLQKHGASETDVVVVDLDDTEERALNVSQNNPHIAGEFTADLQPLLDTREPMGVEALAELRLDELGTRDTLVEEQDIPASAWLVIVECSDDAQQAELLDELNTRGLKVRAA